MGDKESLGARVDALMLMPEALDKIEVHIPGEKPFAVLNTDKTQKSIQIYADITSNGGEITPEEAQRGLRIYGEELRQEEREPPGKHQSIAALERIAAGGKTVRSDVYRNPSFRMHPFSDGEMLGAANQLGTPVLLFHERTIRERARRLNNTFSWMPGFVNFAAYKAVDCIPIARILGEEGMGADCASVPELVKAGYAGVERLMLTSNATPAETFREGARRGATITIDDVTHIQYFLDNVGPLPETVALRYNPGWRMSGGNRIIGEPGRQKYGIPYEDITKAARMLIEHGVQNIGLHEMIVSNERNAANLIGAVDGMVDLANELQRDTGRPIAFINRGGGFGEAYKPEQRPLDIDVVSNGMRDVWERKVLATPNKDMKLYMENGRWLTANSAVLLMSVIHIEQKPGGIYAKVDASGNDFARVEVYDAFHDLVPVGKAGKLSRWNVAGPKCENSDHEARGRMLPEMVAGDVLALCGAGAHGHPMGGSYNSIYPCGEAIIREDGRIERLSRAKNLADDLRKYDFPGSPLAGLWRKHES